MYPISKKTEYPKEILEVHQEFQLAAEQLLLKATEILNSSIKSAYDKAERLRALGFEQAIQSDLVGPVGTKKQEERINREIVNRIRYYKFNYPDNKFITEEQVKTICNKYNLVFGEVKRYKGYVPDSNLDMIEKFSYIIKDEDIADDIIGSEKYDGMQVYDKGKLAKGLYGCKFYPITEKSSLKICAPETDMDTSKMSIIDGYRITDVKKNIPDPVVLQPVKDGYLIVTAWGNEASDENVVNENHN